ncbi:Rft protein-domain-containing protein [Elsinoe ampelina]|uniref:Man(5)GlcNAc(2)-PP-dolichol translocation protein RFT1 n=1 Tax=Elsinoe ampelina TaxID=302913 RepID=A0A6A6FYA0_9PEZI|nr:Rft protein-domain-containing protein [Elsinoe ampelina]
MSSSATSAAAKGATYLIALQVSSRALTFLLNQILLRFLTPATLGRAVQLELYSISVLFFARESLRVAVQRVGSTPSEAAPDATKSENNPTTGKPTQSSGGSSQSSKAVQTVVNLSYLSLVLGIPLALLLGYASWKGLSGTTESSTPYIGHAMFLYGLAAIVELASEPGFVAAQALLLFKVRAGAEAAATVVKTFSTVGSAIFAHRNGLDIGVLPFALGQLAFASTLLVYYAFKLIPQGQRDGFSLLPAFLPPPSSKAPTSPKPRQPEYLLSLLSLPLLRIATSLTIQSTLKYILTQGDSLLITALASLPDQGSYALASNYGGLIARMLFQPIEETSRNLFAKLCSSPPPTPSSPPTPSPHPLPPSPPSPSILRARQILVTILKSYLLLSLPILTLGPSLAPTLLHLIAGPRWLALGAGDVLASYAYYIPLLALNGVLEAFVSATATNRELYGQSLFMGAWFLAFAGTAWVGVGRMGWGAKGVVFANGVNMMGRIGWGWGFVGGWFAGRGGELGLVDVLPRGGSVAAAVAVPVVLRGTEGWLGGFGVVGELVRNGVVGLGLMGAIAVFEREFFRECYGLVNSSR